MPGAAAGAVSDQGRSGKAPPRSTRGLHSKIPVFAETREFLQSPFTFTLERMQRFGPVVYTNGLLRPNVMLCGSEALSYFYDEDLVQRYGGFPPNFPFLIGGKILPMTDGRFHAERRAIVEQAFMHPGALADYLRRLDATVSAYVMRWTRQKDVDLLQQIHLLSGAVTGLIGFCSMGEGEELAKPMKHHIGVRALAAAHPWHTIHESGDG